MAFEPTTTNREQPQDGQGGPPAQEVEKRERTPSPLDSGKGVTTISDVVVTKVASIAAREVAGVHNLGSAGERAIGGITQAVGISDERTQGVAVETGEREAAVDLTIIVEFGESIPAVARRVRENIIKRIEAITGLIVTEVNIAVNDLHFVGDDQPAPTGRVS